MIQANVSQVPVAIQAGSNDGILGCCCYDDFCNELLKAGFSIGGGGNDRGGELATTTEH